MAIATVIGSKWLQAVPGEVIDLGDSVYNRGILKPSTRAPGSKPVEIRNGYLLRDDTIGSTDTLLLQSGPLRDLVLRNLFLEVDDRAAIKTEGPKGARKVALFNCYMSGRGAGPIDPLWKDSGKWGQHHYFTGAWTEVGTRTEKVFQEHADYRHQIAGNHAWVGCSTKWIAGSRLFIVNRKKEVTTPMPVGYGDIYLLNDYAEDCGIAHGGSVYQFRGGCPTTNVKLERCTVRLGCNKDLALPFRKSITGALVMDSSRESKPGAGDDAHPGGTKSLTLIEPDFEVGTVWAGEGSARRSNVKVGAVQSFHIEWGDTGRIVGGTNGIALEVQKSCLAFSWSGRPKEWRGTILFRGKPYQNWDAFARDNVHLEAAA